jgi:hypothetical protein
MMRKEDEAMKDLIFGKPTENILKDDLLAIMMAIFGTYTELLNHGTDILLLNVIYQTGVQNQDKNSYMFATVFLFMCLTSVYLIAYSSMVNMLLFKGVYEPAQVRKNTCCQVFLKILFLTFIGPVYFIFVELTSELMVLFTSLAMIFGGSRSYLNVRMMFIGFIEKFFHLTEEQVDGLKQ